MSIERLVLSNLVTNEAYTRKTLPYIKEDYFKTNAEKTVFKFIQSFVGQYNVNPTKEALAISVSGSNMQEGLFAEVIDIIKEVEPDNNDMEWLVNTTEGWAQDAAIYKAIQESIDIADGVNKDLDKNAIPAILMEALGVSFDSHVGHSYFDSAEEQWEYKHSLQSKFPFTLNIFNKMTKNGVPNKTLNVVAAPINGGKSIHLIQQSADWLSGGKNVLYISMEMAEEEVRERVDVVMMDMTFDSVMALEKSQYVNRINALRKKTSGELVIKEFPPGAAHVGHFRHLLQELKIKKNFVPDMIAVDYLTICASSKLPASARGNTNTYFTAVAEELRAMAKEFNVPVWTAVQLDRGSQGASDAGMGNVALAIGISATADFMFVLLAPDELQARKQMIGKVIKNRYSSYKGTKFLIGMDPDKQRFSDVADGEQAIVMSEDELKDMGLPNKVPDGRKSVDTSKLSEWKFE